MYCPYGLRCQFVHSVRSFEEGVKEDEDGKVQKNYSYTKILEENTIQMMVRIKTSENPDLIEFNTALKDL